jgi:hypothetical protein
VYWKHYYLIQAVQTESIWQNSKEEVLGQWELYSFDNQLNCCEIRKVYDNDDGNDNYDNNNMIIIIIIIIINAYNIPGSTTSRNCRNSHTDHCIHTAESII